MLLGYPLMFVYYIWYARQSPIFATFAAPANCIILEKLRLWCIKGLDSSLRDSCFFVCGAATRISQKRIVIDDVAANGIFRPHRGVQHWFFTAARIIHDMSMSTKPNFEGTSHFYPAREAPLWWIWLWKVPSSCSSFWPEHTTKCITTFSGMKILHFITFFSSQHWWVSFYEGARAHSFFERAHIMVKSQEICFTYPLSVSFELFLA